MDHKLAPLTVKHPFLKISFWSMSECFLAVTRQREMISISFDEPVPGMYLVIKEFPSSAGWGLEY